MKRRANLLRVALRKRSSNRRTENILKTITRALEFDNTLHLFPCTCIKFVLISKLSDPNRSNTAPDKESRDYIVITLLWSTKDNGSFSSFTFLSTSTQVLGSEEKGKRNDLSVVI